jgi:hypothetical protein
LTGLVPIAVIVIIAAVGTVVFLTRRNKQPKNTQQTHISQK